MKFNPIWYAFSILVMESAFVNGFVMGKETIFSDEFPLYMLSSNVWWWHIGLFMNFVFFYMVFKHAKQY